MRMFENNNVYVPRGGTSPRYVYIYIYMLAPPTGAYLLGVLACLGQCVWPRRKPRPRDSLRLASRKRAGSTGVVGTEGPGRILGEVALAQCKSMFGAARPLQQAWPPLARVFRQMGSVSWRGHGGFLSILGSCHLSRPILHIDSSPRRHARFAVRQACDP